MLITKPLLLDGLQGDTEKRVNRTIGTDNETLKQSTQQTDGMLRGFV